MKSLIYSTLIALAVFSPSISFANLTDVFPKIGGEYRMIYSALQPLKDGESQGVSNERSVTLKILQIQPNGWVLAVTIDYRITRSAPTPQNRFGDVTGTVRYESAPSWYNLNAFSKATEVKAAGS